MRTAGSILEGRVIDHIAILAYIPRIETIATKPTERNSKRRSRCDDAR
jgi:hypothetical protein